MKYSVITSSYNQKKLFEKSIHHWDAQTFTDFELIVGDDGSSDGIGEWLAQQTTRFPLRFVTQEDLGYRFTKAVNNAANLATGEYLLFTNGDTYPSPDFIAQIDAVMQPKRVVNGVRINIDWETDKEISKDWRLTNTCASVLDKLAAGETTFRVDTLYKYPWELMTLTGFCIERAVFEAVGGLSSVYDEGYGKMDWSLAMKALYSGCELWYATKAILYHEYDANPRADTPNSTISFLKELDEWQRKGTRP